MKASVAARIFLIALVAVGCGSEPSTVEPSPDVRLSISPAAAELELRDSLRLEIEATGLSNLSVISWTSSDARIASVSQSGVVTGVAPGSARITASAGGTRASADVTVTPWNFADELVVVDSTRLRLVSTDAELEAGTYRFEVLGSGAIPTIAVGSLLAGAERGGFLRRVDAVSSGAATITTETHAAVLGDVIEEGTIDFDVDLLGASLEIVGPVDGSVRLPARTSSGIGVRAGPVYVRSAVGGVRVLAAQGPMGASIIDVTDFDVCKYFKDNDSDPQNHCPAGVSFKVPKLRIDFDPSFEFGSTWESGELTAFEGIAKGSLATDFAVNLGATASATFSREREIFEIGRIVYIQVGALPVVVHVDIGVKGKFEAGASVKASLQGGLGSTHSVDIGARWSEAQGWEGVFTSDASFTPHEPSVADNTAFTELQLSAKVTLTPQLHLKFYGVAGPLLGLGPYAKASLTASSQSCGFDSEGGLDGTVGLALSDFLTKHAGSLGLSYTKTENLATFPGASWACPVGRMDVRTVTSGDELDPDGYQVMIDGAPVGAIATTGSFAVDNVALGTRRVALGGVAPNCTIGGDHPREIEVEVTPAAEVTFEIACVSSASTGDLQVDVSTVGPVPDPDGYLVTVDGTHTQPVGVNTSVTFLGLSAGDRSVVLGDLAPNCAVESANPVTASVPAGGAATASFAVHCEGSGLTVTATANDGYPPGALMRVTVDGVVQQDLGANASVEFTVSDGAHSVELSQIPSNCTLDGANPRTVEVVGSASLTFELDCESGDLVVTANTTGDSTVVEYTVTVDGGDQRAIGAQGGVVVYDELSAGEHLVQLGGAPDHCVVQGQNPRSVTVPGAVTFEVVCGGAPGQVVYQSALMQLGTMAPDGTNQQTLYTSPSGSPEWPSWSPDAARVAFHRRGNGIWIINADGSGLQQLTSDSRDVDPDWSPDGMQVAFRRGGESGDFCGDNLFVVAATGGSPTPITDAAQDSLVIRGEIDWALGGQGIAFVAYEKCGLAGNPGADIYWVPDSGGAATRLTELGATWEVGSPAWSPDGSQIAFLVQPIGGGDSELRLMNATGGSMTTVATLPGCVSASDRVTWAPDSSRFMIGTSCSGQDIRTIDADGSNLTVIVSGGVPNWR